MYMCLYVYKYIYRSIEGTQPVKRNATALMNKNIHEKNLEIYFIRLTDFSFL